MVLFITVYGAGAQRGGSGDVVVVDGVGCRAWVKVRSSKYPTPAVSETARCSVVAARRRQPG